MMSLNKEAPERQDIEALLPWHAAGTLSRRDSDRVENAIASDRELARRYELVREELTETIHLNETLGAPSSRAMEKLFAAIDAEPKVAPTRSFNFVGRVVEFMSNFNSRTLAYAASAAALVLVMQGVVLTTVVVRDQTGTTHTLASANSGRLVWVRFAPQATLADITRLLSAHQAVVVDGPKNGGSYFVRPADPSASAEDFDRLEQQLRADTRLVEFVAKKG